MDDEARKRSIDNLQRVYTVVISLAITESLRRLLSDYGNTGTLPDITSVTAVISLLFTIIPFYHGANRYLDATYVTHERSAKSGALMLDFVAIFLEGIAFFIIALLIQKPQVFYTVLAGLFLFDAAWVAVTKITTETHVDRGAAYTIWSIVNIGAALIILFSVWSNVLRYTLWPTNTVESIAVCIVAILRTVMDYATVWSFYYPAPEGTQYIMPLPRPAPPPESQVHPHDSKASNDTFSPN